MPSLRELLGNMRYDKAISQSAYALFAALVEAVEPEDTGARYAGCKTLDERTIVKLAYELATAKAEIERLRPLAAIGELVRGMGKETFFWRRFDGCYAARTLLLSKMTRPLLRSDFLVGVESRDPTDALRRIQEVGDE